MVVRTTVLPVVDNSGARTALCIGILRVSNRAAVVGDELIVSVRNVVSNKKIMKGDVRLALLVRQKGFVNRYNGLQVSFKSGAVVILNRKDHTLFGNRIKGPVMQELRYKHYLRILCLAPSVI